ncbi:hypothetical protein FGO68_gene3455 [Halteria grandinella]|uniref:Uncharacterized protein n=1 Tax=Halteria grandinella TaxID=5974 RepID=A0A8J8TB93_HALGN|nr:hypothetical protein FGO68_gene3455 [Halteria grandinella]
MRLSPSEMTPSQYCVIMLFSSRSSSLGFPIITLCTASEHSRIFWSTSSQSFDGSGGMSLMRETSRWIGVGGSISIS